MTGVAASRAFTAGLRDALRVAAQGRLEDRIGSLKSEAGASVAGTTLTLNR